MEETQTVVRRAQAGDLEAFNTLVKQFQDMAVAYAYSVLGSFQPAQDAAQEAFIQAYYDLAKLREPAAFPAWFRRIIFKYCDRLTRKGQVGTVPLDMAYGLASSEKTPAETVEDRELKAAIHAAIQALPDNERAVTLLFYIGEYSQKEIADFLDIRVSTVEHRLRAARKHLKERILTMVQDSLHAQRPSRDDRFAEIVIDQLTRLANREGLRAQLREDLEQLAAVNSGLGLILIDIDHFQSFNEQYGHVMADCLLAALANACAIRSSRATLLPGTAVTNSVSSYMEHRQTRPGMWQTHSGPPSRNRIFIQSNCSSRRRASPGLTRPCWTAPPIRSISRAWNS